MAYKHYFFDMDKTIAPSREPILPHMYELLENCGHDVVLVSGQLCEKIEWQSNKLNAAYLGQNGNHVLDFDNTELWHTPLSQSEID